MDENTKRRFDAIADLWKNCWLTLNDRRVYEWRASYAVWGLLAGFIYLIVTKAPPLNIYNHLFFRRFIFVGVLICGIHALWLYFMFRSYTTDRRMAFEYEDEMRILAGFKFSSELQSVLATKRIQQQRPLTYWANLIQLAVTFVLFTISILLLLNMSPSPPLLPPKP